MGEKSINSDMAGSSPHTRGTPQMPADSPMAARFIPAYAGNATVDAFSARFAAVHPRIRGERIVGRFPCNLVPGSSPHTRGTRQHWEPLSLLSSVHPRIRGERLTCPSFSAPVLGSSPHTRGTHLTSFVDTGICRFIPAYAGNAGPAGPRSPGSPVHPRIRGERTSNKLLIYQGKIAPSDSTKHSAC